MGLALARRFGRSGAYRVVLVARRADPLARLVYRLGRERIAVEPFLADAGDPHMLTGVLDEIAATIGAPSVLIYNAPGIADGDLYDGSADEVIDTFEVSVIGALTALRYVVPMMRAAGQGTVVITFRRPASQPSSRHTAQSLSGAALRTMIDLFIADERTSPVRVIMADVAAGEAAGDWEDVRARAARAEVYWALVHDAAGTSGAVTIP